MLTSPGSDRGTEDPMSAVQDVFQSSRHRKRERLAIVVSKTSKTSKRLPADDAAP